MSHKLLSMATWTLMHEWVCCYSPWDEDCTVCSLGTCAEDCKTLCLGADGGMDTRTVVHLRKFDEIIKVKNVDVA